MKNAANEDRHGYRISGGSLFIMHDIKSQMAYAVFVVAIFAAFLPDGIRMALKAVDDSGAPMWTFHLALLFVPVFALTVFRQLTMPIHSAAMVD